MTNIILEKDLKDIDKLISSKGDWSNATILITGCAGFLGFYFMQYFARYGTKLNLKKIIGLDNFLLQKPKWLTILQKDFPELVDLYDFDISKNDIDEIKGIYDVQYLIHAASIASPSFYRKYPVETIDANIWGLRKILDFYKQKKQLKGMLFFSSSEIYGDPDSLSIPTNEDYRGNVSCNGPRACYDESKRFGETLCWVYAKKYGMPITIARPFNNYGPGMVLTDKRLPADFAKSIVEDRDLIIFSDGSPTRTFCYISDAITGYLLCLTYGQYDYFNIGNDAPEISVNEFAKIFKNNGHKIFGYQRSILHQTSNDTDYMTDNPNRRCPDISKARNKLKYIPKVSVEEGVERYLKFLKEESK